MKLDYESLEEVITRNKEVIIIDMTRHVYEITDLSCFHLLKEPEDGIYLQNSVEPLIDFSQRYFYKHKSGMNNRTLIKDFESNVEKILNSNRTIIDSRGKQVIDGQAGKALSKIMLKGKPSKAMMIKAGVSIALDYLNSLCSYHGLSYGEYTLANLLKDEYRQVQYEQMLEVAFDPLILEVRDFVGNDTYNFYFYKVMNDNLILEKSVDYRIYDWYRIQFEKQAEVDDSINE